MASKIRRSIQELRGVTLASAASDLAVAQAMAHAALTGAVENVRANLPSIHDAQWVAEMETKLLNLG
jgi:formiminotetrahydrofolate cyclodeaminase